MYADALILITQAIRKVAININFCFSIYANLTGQLANNSKSKIYFPNRFNVKLKKSICAILYFKAGALPLTYLSMLISHKNLSISHFSSMDDKLDKMTSSWNQSYISPTGKNILINSYYPSILSFYISHS